MTEQLKLVVLGIGKAAKRMNTFKIENTKKNENINNKPRKRQKITHNSNTNDDKVKKELNNILKKADLNVLHKQLKKWGNECSECMTLIKSMLKILDINDEQPNRDINDKKNNPFLRDKLILTKQQKDINRDRQLIKISQNALRLKREIFTLENDVSLAIKNNRSADSILNDEFSNNLKQYFTNIKELENLLPKYRLESIGTQFNTKLDEFKSAVIECNFTDIFICHNDIKTLLDNTNLQDKPDLYPKLLNPHLLREFHSTNKILENDLNELRNFGIDFDGERIGNMDNITLKLKFNGHFDSKYNGLNIPCLVVLLNENGYKHIFDFNDVKQDINDAKDNEYFMDISYELPTNKLIGKKRNINTLNNNNNIENKLQNNNSFKFNASHLGELTKIKNEFIRNNGPFIHIIGVFNFYQTCIQNKLNTL